MRFALMSACLALGGMSAALAVPKVYVANETDGTVSVIATDTRQTVRTIPVGVAYAVWAGMGIVMVSVAALFIYGQKLDLPAMLGMGLIVLGVVVIQLFSKTAGH